MYRFWGILRRSSSDLNLNCFNFKKQHKTNYLILKKIRKHLSTFSDLSNTEKKTRKMASDRFTLNLHIPDIKGLFMTPGGVRRVESLPVQEAMLDWTIEAHPYLFGLPKKMYLAVFIWCNRRGQRYGSYWSCKADCRIVLKNQSHIGPDIIKSYQYVFTNEGYRIWQGDWKFCSYTLIEGTEYRIDDGIHIQVEVTPGDLKGLYFQEKTDILSEYSLSKKFTSNDTSLHFLETGEGSNLTVVSSDGVEFKVHHGILAKKSQVFASMFESGMEETKTGTLELKDMDKTSLKAFLRVMYLGDLSLVEACPLKQVMELINASEKYGLLGLKKYLGYVLVERCTFKNALKLYAFGSQFMLEDAQKEIFQFAQEHFKDVWRTLAMREVERGSCLVYAESEESEEEEEEGRSSTVKKRRVE